MRKAAAVLATLGISLAFGTFGAYNLANYRPVSNDEVELMAVGYKLATQGVLGSDMYVGFFGADQHFLITLPLQHVLQALAFRGAGAGVAQARWVSLLAGVSVVWLVGWLAYRWFGLGTAVLCELLLVAWPSNLTAASNGLPLLGVSRTARYDVLALAAAWLAIALLDLALRRPRPGTGFWLGVCCGLAALTQFMGAFVLPLVVLNWLLARRPARLLVWILGGVVVVVGPWLLYAAAFPADLAGQLSVFGGRGDFLRPGFYVENLTSEFERYRHLNAWLLVLGLGLAVAYLARHQDRLGDRILLTSLITFGGLLWLLDQTKAALYAIVLLPSICLALARTATAALSWVGRHSRPLGVALGAGLVVGIALAAQPAYQVTLAQAEQVSDYAAVGQQIEDALAPGARVLGPERWWWALHTHPYRSLRSLWWQWPGGAAWADADYIVVNDNVRADLLHFPAAVQQRFWTYLDTCAKRTLEFSDPTYFGIEVYQTIRPTPDAAVCG